MTHRPGGATRPAQFVCITRLTESNTKRLRREPHQECVAAADC